MIPAEVHAPEIPSGHAVAEPWNEILGGLRKNLLEVLARRGVELHLAEDLVQESLLRVWARSHQLRDRGRLAAWARSIALNRLRSHSVRTRPHLELPEIALAPGRGPLEAAIHREALGFLGELLASLDPQDRDTIQQRHQRALVPETSRELSERGACAQKKPAPSRRRLHAAMERLRRRALTRPGRCTALAFGLLS
jgi:RNA polymerase sigma factor (sigma-70 family)